MRTSRVIIALLLLSIGNIWAQATAPAPAPVAVQTAPVVQPQTYFLHDIAWIINGRTKAWALESAVKITRTETWANQEALKAWVDDTTQLILNERVLDTAKIEYVLGAPQADGTIPVDFTITVKDTWNIIALPKPQYSSSDGLDLSIRARDYNFLGTLQPLKLNFGYMLDADAFKAKDLNAATYYADIDVNLPFQAMGKDWIFDFDHSFAWTEDKKFQYTNKTGVSVDLPWRTTTFTLGGYQYYYLNQENSDEYKTLLGQKYYDDTWFMQSSLVASWEIPTGIVVGKFGKLTYTPGTSLDYKYRPDGLIGDERVGPTTTLSQALAFSRIDWIQNFRRGVSADITNSNTWNFHKETWDNSISSSLITHAAFWKYFGFSTKLYGIYHFQETDTSAGVNLRGILDDDVSADSLATINVDLPVSVIRFMPYKWFGAKAFKPFQFEQIWSPFFDGAIGHRKGGHLNGKDDILYCGGLEVITYPVMFRSLFLRISCGFDLRDFPGQKEIYIGLDHHY